jgi:flagellin-specific chaperone FliS
MCKYCGKVYKHIQSLYSHLKISKTRKIPLSNVSKMYPKCIQQKLYANAKNHIIPVKYINQIVSEMINVREENGICERDTTNNTINNNYTTNVLKR